MPLPDTIRVKLSTEAAEAISLTPVVLRDMPFLELFELIVALTGKQPARIRDLLARGTIVSGASRFRWQGLDTELADIDQMLAALPDSDPARPFQPGACVKAILRAPFASIEITRDAASRRRFLRRTCFWDALLSLPRALAPSYVEYSYRERADRYRLQLDVSQRTLVRDTAKLLPYSSLTQQIQRTPIDAIEFLTAR